MIYYTDDNVEMVRNSFDIDTMLDSLLQHGLIDEITGDYSQDVYDMCNNCTLLLGKHLMNFIDENKILVCEGVFAMMGNHTWIKIDNLIFDLTLAQFVPTAPSLAVLKENNHYQSIREYSFDDWLSNML